MTDKDNLQKPNILKVEITKELIEQEWKKSMPVLDKGAVRMRKQKFIEEEWKKSYPKIDYINYACIEELANRTEYIGSWMRDKSADFNSMITMPEWAAKDLKVHEVEEMRDGFMKVNSLNRKVSEQKSALAKHFVDFSKKIDEQYESDLADLLDKREKLFILTYPKNQLPIHYVLSSIQYLAKDKMKSETDKAAEGDKYVSPTDYDNNLLDSWRKKLWSLHIATKDVKQYIKDQGVNFYIPDKSVGDGHLSSIAKYLTYDISTRNRGGIL